VLEVELAQTVSKHGISALVQVSSLQEFLFGTNKDYNDRRQAKAVKVLIGLCFEFLPHLHAVAFKVPATSSDCENSSVLMASAMSLVRSQRTLQLRQLAVPYLSSIPEHVSLPELQQLCLTECINSIQPSIPAGISFPNLTELIMLSASNQYLMLVLGHVGRQLQKLRCNMQDSVLELEKVLDACPNLSKLNLAGVGFKLPWFKVRPETLRRMRTLKLSCIFGFVSPGMLCQFLRSAPLLRHFQLETVSLRLEDLNELAELAKQGTSMKHLEHITLDVNCRQCDKSLFEEAIFNCITHCPQLRVGPSTFQEAPDTFYIEVMGRMCQINLSRYH
jgi:hypothetical protein